MWAQVEPHQSALPCTDLLLVSAWPAAKTGDTLTVKHLRACCRALSNVGHFEQSAWHTDLGRRYQAAWFDGLARLLAGAVTMGGMLVAKGCLNPRDLRQLPSVGQALQLVREGVPLVLCIGAVVVAVFTATNLATGATLLQPLRHGTRRLGNQHASIAHEAHS